LSAVTVRYKQKANRILTSLEIAQIQGEFQSFDAIWDTGASCSIITEKVIDRLDLVPVGETTIQGVTGSKKVNKYAVEFLLPNDYSMKLMVNSCSEMLGCDVLIGMDIISMGDFAITANSKGSTFSFQIPHGKEIDFKSVK
jgi:hypothetical protein